MTERRQPQEIELPAWVRWGLGVTGALLSAGVLSAIGYAVEARKEQAVVAVKIDALIEKVVRIEKVASEDRYRGGDAQRDFALRDARISDLERRLLLLEK